MTEQEDEAEREWRSGFKLKSTSPAPFPPAYPGRYFQTTVYLRINCNLEFPDIGLRLAPNATPGSFGHDSENVYEWMCVDIRDLPFALNVSREHGWADIDDKIESTASAEELRSLVNPGPVYMFGWNRSSGSYVDELPEWLPQFVADRLNEDVLVYNRRINVDIPDGEPITVVHPQHGNANS